MLAVPLLVAGCTGARCRSRGAVVTGNGAAAPDLLQQKRMYGHRLQIPGTYRAASVPLTVVVRNTGEFQVLLDRGATAVALAALGASEAASFPLALDIVQTGLAEVMAA